MVTILSLAVLVILALVALSIVSRSGGKHGLIHGKLPACPQTHNCVCTEAFDNKNAEPIAISGLAADAAWEQMRSAIRSTGGTIEADDGGYLWATYTTPLLRFVDDFEARLDEPQGVIHLRSASRVGHSDMGANSKRVKQIIAAFQEHKPHG